MLARVPPSLRALRRDFLVSEQRLPAACWTTLITAESPTAHTGQTERLFALPWAASLRSAARMEWRVQLSSPGCLDPCACPILKFSTS